MESNCIERLTALGYKANPGVDYVQALDEGLRNEHFINIIYWLTLEIGKACDGLYSCVRDTRLDSSKNMSSFMIELSEFLREIDCPHTTLVEGPMDQRFDSSSSQRMLLVEYLCSELEAARIIKGSKPLDMKVVKESDTAKDLKDIIISLGFSKPPITITAIQLFSRIESKVKEIVGKNPIDEPLFHITGMKWDQKQWYKLYNFQSNMQEEYKMRRLMLLKRLDLTVQSFGWSNRIQDKSDKMYEFSALRDQMSMKPEVDISDLLAATKDLTINQKTSDSAVRKRTESHINKVIIAAVPDRGGRPEEQCPPPPEVPSWMKSNPQQSQSAGGVRRKEDSGHSNSRNWKERGAGDNASRGYHSRGGNYDRGSGGRHYDRGDNSGNYDRRGRGGNYDRGGSGNYDRRGRGGNYDRGGSGGNYDHGSSGKDRGRGGYIGASGDYAQGCRAYSGVESNEICYTQSQTSGAYIGPVDHSGNYMFANQMQQSQYGMPPPAVHVFPQDVYGFGMGGYARTGGNFQQFGDSATSLYSEDCAAHQDRGYNPRGSRGGRSRGRRGGRQ